MSLWRLILPWGRRALFTAAGWLAVCATCMAQLPQQKKAEPEGGSYVSSYAIVILVVALAIAFVCRPCRRRDRARPESYDEIKVKPGE
jgi:hypothetical protein